MNEVSTITEALPAVECAPWCQYGDGHPDAHHPDDQWCTGPLHGVKLTREGLVNYGDTESPDWRLDHVAVSLQKSREGQPHAYLNRGDDPGVHLTLTEARELRDHLTAVLLEAGERA